MNKELVSVVVPFYENTNLLEKAVKSVLLQTYKNFEIIIINDKNEKKKFKFFKKNQKKVKKNKNYIQ